MLCLTCTIISREDLARYGVSRAKILDIWGLFYNLDLDKDTILIQFTHLSGLSAGLLI